jgi:hypothetical protein
MLDTLSARFQSLFARNQYAFWWNEYSDYERSLSRMSLSELAGELERTKVQNESANTIIVEHLLAVRLARIQSRASMRAAWVGVGGALLAAVAAFYLGKLSSDGPLKAECAPSVAVAALPADAPVPTITSGKLEQLRGMNEAGARVRK